ncbi:MAG: hypothetical protein VB876_01950 [Pirellulales bacterium]
MTMVRTLRLPNVVVAVCRPPLAGRMLATVVMFLAAGSVMAQQPRMHYRHSSNLPPGAIGRAQLQRGGPLHGYFQPVEIAGPKGAKLALTKGGGFEPLQQTPRRVGLLIGQVYRFRVTNIPDQPGVEVFPTIEIIDRIYPPAGREAEFPIPIHVTAGDLFLAARGKFVTRAIYLESPRHAVPARQNPNDQNWFEARPGEDPLKVADLLGRPVAILRMGGRLPAVSGANSRFLYGSAPWKSLDQISDEQEGPMPIDGKATAYQSFAP